MISFLSISPGVSAKRTPASKGFSRARGCLGLSICWALGYVGVFRLVSLGDCAGFFLFMDSCGSLVGFGFFDRVPLFLMTWFSAMAM